MWSCLRVFVPRRDFCEKSIEMVLRDLVIVFNALPLNMMTDHNKARAILCRVVAASSRWDGLWREFQSELRLSGSSNCPETGMAKAFGGRPFFWCWVSAVFFSIVTGDDWLEHIEHPKANKDGMLEWYRGVSCVQAALPNVRLEQISQTQILISYLDNVLLLK
jgi:hypothetical protein